MAQNLKTLPNHIGCYGRCCGIRGHAARWKHGSPTCRRAFSRRFKRIGSCRPHVLVRMKRREHHGLKSWIRRPNSDLPTIVIIFDPRVPNAPQHHLYCVRIIVTQVTRDTGLDAPRAYGAQTLEDAKTRRHRAIRSGFFPRPHGALGHSGQYPCGSYLDRCSPWRVPQRGR
jgi:hypothetical protein